MKQEKTVEQINEWFVSEIKDALLSVPEGIKKMAKGNIELMKLVAHNIGEKKCFNENEVLKYLPNILN